MTHTDRQRPREMVARAIALADGEDYMEDYRRYDRRAAAAIKALRDLGYFRHDELALIKQEERAE